MSLLMSPKRLLEGKEISSHLVALYMSSGSCPERELEPAQKTFSLGQDPNPLGIWPS